MAETPVRKSSANVFEDLDLADSGATLAKAELARRIGGIVEARGLTQVEAAQVLGIDQPKVSALIRGKLSGFSTERLLKLVNALGCDVEIVVRPPRKRGGKIRVLGERR